MLRVESLEIEDHILEKLESKHKVSFAEVRDACLAERLHVRRGREGLYKVFSQTAEGRYILVILVDLGASHWRIVTARDMTDSERRLYLRSMGGR